MKKSRVRCWSYVWILVSWTAQIPAASAQDRLRQLPTYEHYARMAALIPASVRSGALQVSWDSGGSTFEYTRDGRRYRYVVATRTVLEVTDSVAVPAGRGGRGGQGSALPERGRQFDSAISPDGRYRAFYRDRNLWLAATAGGDTIQITTDGSASTRVKYGTASWVYGEELNQRTAMWWSPDGTKLAFYRFDESRVPDYYLQLDQTRLQSRMDIEAYPKAGQPNPVVDVLVYNVAERSTTRVDVRDGVPFSDDAIGHYVYNVGWTPDGRELTLYRTNRRQNVMEFAACDPVGGRCRTVVREEWPASWVENRPFMQYLSDGKRFIWESERNGYSNYYLYDLSGRLLATLTDHNFEVAGVVRLDERAGLLWYLARDGDNHMKLQLHRVGLDGRNHRRLTDPAFHHTVSISPDGRYFVDVAQTHDIPPATYLRDSQGRLVAELARSDLTRFDSLGLKRVELFTFKAADSATVLHGLLHRPSTFDSTRSYPVLVTVYAGPATNAARETFVLPSPLAELGFLVVALDSRSAGGRGKRFLDAIYGRLGQVEIDDQAAGVKALWSRPYVDRSRVGIFGTSYGGYAAAMALLRYPDVFAAASASSPVTDWRNYDTIYTERYMWTPDGNRAGYDAGSVMTYVANLRGRLMLYYGTADNNVHPSNTMQLVQALQRAQKSFDLQVGPDAGHSSVNLARMLEFFVDNLMPRGLPAVR